MRATAERADGPNTEGRCPLGRPTARTIALPPLAIVSRRSNPQPLFQLGDRLARVWIARSREESFATEGPDALDVAERSAAADHGDRDFLQLHDLLNLLGQGHACAGLAKLPLASAQPLQRLVERGRHHREEISTSSVYHDRSLEENEPPDCRLQIAPLPSPLPARGEREHCLRAGVCLGSGPEVETVRPARASSPAGPRSW